MDIISGRLQGPNTSNWQPKIIQAQLTLLVRPYPSPRVQELSSSPRRRRSRRRSPPGAFEVCLPVPRFPRDRNFAWIEYARQMKAGRKNLRRARDEGAAITLAEGESIMQVLTLRGSNVIEVMDGKGVKSLALFPAKFQKSFWIKKGSFVVVDASGRDQALESGSKIACVVSQVLFHDQVRALEKSDDWPAIFKSTPGEGSDAGTKGETAQIQVDEEENSDEDDDLPPLEANTNRNRPFELYSDSESDSDS